MQQGNVEKFLCKVLTIDNGNRLLWIILSNERLASLSLLPIHCTILLLSLICQVAIMILQWKSFKRQPSCALSVKLKKRWYLYTFAHLQVYAFQILLDPWTVSTAWAASFFCFYQTISLCSKFSILKLMYRFSFSRQTYNCKCTSTYEWVVKARGGGGGGLPYETDGDAHRLA